jgi:integrase
VLCLPVAVYFCREFALRGLRESHVALAWHPAFQPLRKADGGLELPIKTVQQRLGHSSIVMTSDTYGHLFPRTDDGREMADAERRLMAVK